MNNPINLIDPTGMAPEDWVLGKNGSIYWDNNAISQATTKAGDTYLGTELSFKFTSYIDKKLWDGPTMGGLVDPSGVKLTSSLKLTGKKNSMGELTSIVYEFSSKPGPTPVGTARNFYPGEGGDNNYFNSSTTSTGININFEQHASVSPIEEFGLNAQGFKIVDVAQKMNIDYNRSNGNLGIDVYTNVFPSANLTVKGNGNSNTFKIMQYNQPSFPATHTAPITGYSPIPMREGVIGGQPIRDFSYYPSVFYKR